MATPLQVFCYIPNLIGYIRIALLLGAWLSSNDSLQFILILLSAALDLFDGMAARKFNQESKFGAWLDITIDIFTRGSLWIYSNPQLGFPVVCLEFLVFVATQAMSFGGQQSWQDTSKRQLNWVAASIISKGFKSIPGFVAVCGLWGLPIVLYAEATIPSIVYDWEILFAFLLCFAWFGRGLCAFVEVCILQRYILILVDSQ